MVVNTLNRIGPNTMPCGTLLLNPIQCDDWTGIEIWRHVKALFIPDSKFCFITFIGIAKDYKNMCEITDLCLCREAMTFNGKLQVSWLMRTS